MSSGDRASQPAELLRRARTARDWTQEETADRIRRACLGDDGACSMNADRYAAFEAGLLHPGTLHTQAICEVFQVEPADLGLDSPPDPSGNRA